MNLIRTGSNDSLKRLISIKYIGQMLFILLIFLFLFSVFPSSACSNYMHEDSSTQTQGNMLDVTTWVYLSERYGFFELVQHEVFVNVTIYTTEAVFPENSSLDASVLFSLQEVTNLPEGAYYSFGYWGRPPSGVLSVYFPANTSFISLGLRGIVDDRSVFWRNSAEVALTSISPNFRIDHASYKFSIALPSNSKLLKVYSPSYFQLPYEEKRINGRSHIMFPATPTGGPIIVLYEPDRREIYALILMFVVIFMIFIIPYALRPKAKTRASKPFDTLRKMYISTKKYGTSEKLLAAYILCSLLMVSLSFAAGPDSRLKVYVLAKPETAEIIGRSINLGMENFIITPEDEMNEFKTLTELGVVQAVVIADFVPPSEHALDKSIYPALNSAPVIIILRPYATQTFALETQKRYGAKTLIIEETAALNSVLYEIPRSMNPLGLTLSPRMFISFAAFIGLCSFIVVFIGLSFLTFKLIEVGKNLSVSGFSEAILYAVFTFLFTQTVYMTSSALLAMPVGLHTSSPKITIIGFLGFGGGSRPRWFAGLAGAIFGTIMALKEGLRLDKAGLVSFLIVVFFILTDPLTCGVIFHEFVLLVTVGPSIEYAYASWLSVRSFFASIATAFGCFVSPEFIASLGIVLYYASIIPLCLFPKLKKTTSSMLLLFCVSCASMGYIRVADMKPWATIASTVPGVIAGFVIAAFFCLLSFAETIIRERIRKSASVI